MATTSFRDLESGANGQLQKPAPAPAPRAQPDAGTSSEWAKSADLLTSNIYLLNGNVSGIERMLASVGGARDTQAIRDKIHRTVEESRAVVRDTEQSLKALNSIPDSTDGARGIQRRKLTKDLQQSLRRFQDVSRVYGEKLRKFPQPPSAAPAQAAEGGRGGAEDDERTSLMASHRREERVGVQAEVLSNAALIQERALAIRDVETRVREVNEIMRDLAVIVSDQGVMLDSIESNVVSAQERTGAAVKELSKASEQQRRSRRAGCILLVLALLVSLALVLWLTGVL